MGLTEPFPVSPQVMETRQVSRSSRVRLLLLLLLLAPWGAGTASGVALPPARVFRYVQCPGPPGRGGHSERRKETQNDGGTETQEGDRDPEKGGQGLGAGRDGGGRGIGKKKRNKKKFRERPRETRKESKQKRIRPLNNDRWLLGVCPAMRWGRTSASDSVSGLRELRTRTERPTRRKRGGDREHLRRRCSGMASS